MTVGYDLFHQGGSGVWSIAARMAATNRANSCVPLRRVARLALALGFLAGLVIAPRGASAETRSLSFYNTHTEERATVVFKRDGVFDPDGLKEMNRLLRDWRRNEATKMDPELFDLVWEVYRDSGSQQPIHIVSGYRSPATNNLLRSRSRGVAKLSQHMLGKAMDFFLPDVPLDRLRAIGMKKQIGGVGFYPTSGSPFVHMDTGSVRAWPRMTHEQLVRLFPDGKTLHLPSDGEALPRYAEAAAERRSKPNVASGENTSGTAQGGGNLISWLFGNGAKTQQPSITDDEEDGAPAAPKPQELRQGPLPAGSNPTVVADAAPDPLPLPPPPAPRTATEAAPMPVLPASVATTQAPGSLVAMPAPQAAPRAPGSLFASANRASQPILPPVQDAPPPGWVRGPQPLATASASPPVPKPTTADDPIKSLTRGRTQAPVPASALGFAPALPDAKPAGREAVAAKSASGVILASLPQAAVANDDARPIAPNVAAPAIPAAARAALSAATSKADRADPMAKLFAPALSYPDDRFIDGRQTTRTATFAQLTHPDCEGLPQLIAKPAHLVVSGFGPTSNTGLRADRFNGPAVLALSIVRVN